MTDKQHPEALRLADWLQAAVQIYPQRSEDEPGGYASEVDQVMDDAAAELRRQHAENETLRAGYAAARLEIESLQSQLHAAKQINAAQFGLLAASIPGAALRPPHGQAPAQAAHAAVAGASEAVAYLDIGAGGYLDLGTDLTDEALSRLPKGRHALVIAGTYGIDGYITAPTAQPAPQQEAPADELEEVLRERDDAEDFINELLDEVLGADRPELSSAYSRYDAMNDVRERITALHKPAVDKAWGRFELAMAAPHPSPAAQGDAMDAARYRWLREGNDAKHGAAWHVAVNLYGCEWDAAIDAARKQGANHD